MMSRYYNEKKRTKLMSESQTNKQINGFKMNNYIVAICKITNVDCFKWNTE